MNTNEIDELEAFVRAYSYPTHIDGRSTRKRKSSKKKDTERGMDFGTLAPVHSYQCLTFDTETVLTPDKSLLYGFYMVTGYNREEVMNKFLFKAYLASYAKTESEAREIRDRVRNEEGIDITELEPGCRDTIREAGVFYSDELTPDEIEIVKKHAKQTRLSELGKLLRTEVDSVDSNLRVMKTEEFVNRLYILARREDLLVIGLNLPFDLSRLMHTPDSFHEGTGKYKGAFCLDLAEDCTKPAIRIYHVGFAKNLYSLEQSYHLESGKKVRDRAYEGLHFLDLSQLSASLLGPGSWSLKSLGKTLNIPLELRKQNKPEEDFRPGQENLSYALQDVIATYACFMKLRDLYAKHELNEQTAIWNLVSGASLGKAYLKKIGIRPFQEQHPTFLKEVIGYAMNAFLGARSEIAVRLKPVHGRLRDFSGQYPLVCSLLGIQNYWLAESITVNRQAQEKAQSILSKSVDELLEFLHEPSNWKHLFILCKVKPTSGLDRFPIRAQYGKIDSKDKTREETEPLSTNITLPYVSSDVPLWYTIQDCIASKLLTGETPEIVEAIALVASNEQYEVEPVRVMGEESALIDLSQDEFFTRIGDLRQEYKRKAKQAKDERSGEEEAYADSIQTALKLLQNSTSYGSLVEILVSEPTERKEGEEVFFYTSDGEQKSATVSRTESPGKYFSPLGPFITASGRLLLAIAERLGVNAGFGVEPGEGNPPHAFCDTDSMFYVCPPDMPWQEFDKRDREIGTWFQALSPYAGNTEVFKLEQDNCYCFGVSAKRYVLYKLHEETRGREIKLSGKRKTTTEKYTVKIPTIVKLSSHGLGAISPPYSNDNSPFSDIPEPVGDAAKYHRWIYDFWYKAIYEVENSQNWNGYIMDAHKGFTGMAQHQITISSPHLLQSYSKLGNLRPFSFFTVLPPISRMRYIHKYSHPFLVNPLGEIVEINQDEKEFYASITKKHTPFYVAPLKLDDVCPPVYRCDTNEMVPIFFDATSVSEQLYDYFVHRELKAANPDGRGIMQVRHVHVTKVRYMGKEISERLEEIAEESNGHIGGWHEQEFRKDQDNEESLIRRARRNDIADLLFLSGIPRMSLYNLLGEKLKRPPYIKTVNALKRALIILEGGDYKKEWREIEPVKLAEIIGSTEIRAKRLQQGQETFLPIERNQILKIMGVQ